jgi:carboxymethylenebutenolidase
MAEALTAGPVTITGADADEIPAYLAGPTDPDGASGRGGVVVIHHMPGFDRATHEIIRRFAAFGFSAIGPNLHHRYAPGADSDDAAAAARAAGGVPDDQLVGDVAGAIARLRSVPGSNGRVGVIGFCSGGRQSVLAACRLPLDAAVDCYGAFVLARRDPSRGLPTVGPLTDLLTDLSCPLLGLFGAEDQNPAPAEVQALQDRLAGLGKTVDFHTYPDAGHGFFAVDRPSYRPAAAVDGWQRVIRFFGQHLGTGE